MIIGPVADTDSAELLEEVDASLRRRRRYALAAWRSSYALRLGARGAAWCMTPIQRDDGVDVSVSSEGTTHTEGVKRCGSLWCCPVCAPIVRETRAAEIDTAVRSWLDQGGSAWFVTYTIPHRATDELARLLELVQWMYSDCWSGTYGKELREQLGIIGSIRAVEVTWSRKNGWHAHIHAVHLAERGMFDAWSVADRWRWAFGMRGFASQYVAHVSCDIRRVHSTDVSAYLAKVTQGWGVGLEVARTDLKRGRGLGPAELLELATTGEAEHVARWCEFEAATKGRKAIVWSPGLRGLLLPDPDETTDEEAATGPAPVEVVARYRVSAAAWKAWRRAGALAVLLERLVYCDPPEGVERLPVSSIGPPAALAA